MFKRAKRGEVGTPGVVCYSRFVSHVKTLLIVLLALITAALVIWPLLSPVRKHMKLTFTSVTSDDLGMTQMTNPQFEGVDGENRPYHVVAEIAVQETEDTVRLSKVQGEIALKDNGWVKISSENGLMALNSRDLKLYGQVVVESNEGFTLKTEQVLLHLKENLAESQVPVEVDGPTGNLLATGFLLDGNENTVRFTGPVKTVIYPSPAGKGKTQ